MFQWTHLLLRLYTVDTHVLTLLNILTIVMLAFFRKLLIEEDGPTTVEYAVLVALIVAVAIGGVNNLAQGTADSYNNSAGQLAGVLGS